MAFLLLENVGETYQCEVCIHAKGGLRREIKRRIRREAVRVGLLGVEFVSSRARRDVRREEGTRLGDPIPLVKFNASKEQLDEFQECIRKYSEDGWVSVTSHQLMPAAKDADA